MNVCGCEAEATKNYFSPFERIKDIDINDKGKFTIESDLKGLSEK